MTETTGTAETKIPLLTPFVFPLYKGGFKRKLSFLQAKNPVGKEEILKRVQDDGNRRSHKKQEILKGIQDDIDQNPPVLRTSPFKKGVNLSFLRRQESIREKEGTKEEDPESSSGGQGHGFRIKCGMTEVTGTKEITKKLPPKSMEGVERGIHFPFFFLSSLRGYIPPKRVL
ncbi:hypothetical protein CSB09_02285 [Candidatus Gracilibacteria bacterium]|nr:MAG: hypothetical protein CSB09_02285 [Candidatus Gracilibacteria bacterium]